MAPALVGARQYPDAASTREHILAIAIAIDEITERGIVDFRIERIVSATGVSTGGIYHHVKNREGLLCAPSARVVEDVANDDTMVLRTSSPRA
jgi:AcrR family transcriptional regulator